MTIGLPWPSTGKRSTSFSTPAAYIAEYAVERFHRNVRLFRLYEGTSQIQQLIIARETMRAMAG